MRTLLWVIALALLVGGAAWSVQLAFGDDGSGSFQPALATSPAAATAPASSRPGTFSAALDRE